jgi:hypothetical protein
MPNIFDYATSELSQDAALCYFMAYAAPQYGTGPYVREHAFSRALLRKMFEICGKEFPEEFEEFDVTKQYSINGKYLDILVRINDIYIAIEDKRQAQDHSGQLLIYSEIHQSLGIPADDVLLMYIQTGNQASTRNLEEANFKLMSRNTLLSLFETEVGQSARKNSKIHNDFYLHFRAHEEQYQGFAATDVTQWKTPAQIGFVEALIEKNHGQWVAAGGGGGDFRAYRGPAVQIGMASAYLQVEVSNNNEQPQIHLRFKVDVPRVSNREEYIATWTQWHELMMGAVAKSRTNLPIRRPHRATPRNFDNQKVLSHSLLIAKIDDGQDWTTSRVFPTLDGSRRVQFGDTLATLQECQAILESLPR